MDEREKESLIRMLTQLLKEMDYVQSQGAGYYTCAPFATRYNKLVKQAKRIFGSGNALIETFDDLDETDPKDPSDKSKALLGIRIEITQLISFIESTREDKK